VYACMRVCVVQRTCAYVCVCVCVCVCVRISHTHPKAVMNCVPLMSANPSLAYKFSGVNPCAFNTFAAFSYVRVVGLYILPSPSKPIALVCVCVCCVCVCVCVCVCECYVWCDV